MDWLRVDAGVATTKLPLSGSRAWVLSVTVDERIARSEARRDTLGRLTWFIVVILAVANVMSNRILPGWLYLPWNVAVAVGLLVLTRRQLSDRELGLTECKRGLQVGLVLVVVTAAVMLMALAMPAANDLFEDRRVSSGVVILLYQALLRIPFGTVLLEEIAFRSVLPALFARRLGAVRGSIAASALFGLWHVLPALSLSTVNPVAQDVFGEGTGAKIAGVVFAVLGTMLAGLWFCLLRYRSRSVLAPMLAHVATNSIGFTIAWFVTRS